jgi:hypothetical protein
MASYSTSNRRLSINIIVPGRSCQRGLTRFSDLVPDDRNDNRGSKRGAALIKKSLKDYGAGRSILLDKNDRVKRLFHVYVVTTAVADSVTASYPSATISAALVR